VISALCLIVWPFVLSLFLFSREKDRPPHPQHAEGGDHIQQIDRIVIFYNLSGWAGCLAGLSGLFHLLIRGYSVNATTSVFLLTAGLGTLFGIYIAILYIRRRP
jgi:hypothetical protein